MKSENTLFNENRHTFHFKQFIKYISYSLNNKINYKLSYCNYYVYYVDVYYNVLFKIYMT
jgi:hypothetical protein